MASRVERHPHRDREAPLRVLMVVRLFFPWIGGAELQAARLARELTRQGIQVQIVTGRWFRGTPRDDVVEGIRVFRNHAMWEFFGIKGLRKLGGYLYIITLLWYLWRRRHTYDVIHIHGLSYHTFAAVVAGRFLGRPTITKLANSGPGSDIRKMRNGDHLALSRLMLPRALQCDRFVALNGEIVRELMISGVPQRRIVRIPNGIDPTVFAEKTSYQLHDPARLLFVGRLHGQKGLDTLLHSLRSVLTRIPGQRVVLQLLGDGPDRAKLEALAGQLGISAHVAFLGSRDDVRAYLSEADIFVLPSRAEGLSNALLEAMSAGLPVVVSRIPGNEEVVDHAENGLLCAVDDAASLASALMTLLDDQALRQALGRSARTTVDREYGLSGVARSYIGLYRELLFGDRSSASLTAARTA